MQRRAGLVIALAALTYNPSRQVAYPMGYRQWAHVKTMLLQEDHPLYEAFGGKLHLCQRQRPHRHESGKA